MAQPPAALPVGCLSHHPLSSSLLCSPLLSSPLLPFLSYPLSAWLELHGNAFLLRRHHKIVLHLSNFVEPRQQSQIVRIVFMVPTYSVTAFLSLRFMQWYVGFMQLTV